MVSDWFVLIFLSPVKIIEFFRFAIDRTVTVRSMILYTGRKYKVIGG